MSNPKHYMFSTFDNNGLYHHRVDLGTDTVNGFVFAMAAECFHAIWTSLEGKFIVRLPPVLFYQLQEEVAPLHREADGSLQFGKFVVRAVDSPFIAMTADNDNDAMKVEQWWWTKQWPRIMTTEVRTTEETNNEG